MRKLGTLFKKALLFTVLVVSMMGMGFAEAEKDVVLIGLDGASHDFMEKCIEKGEYENIESLMDEGSFKPMEAPRPPLTPVTLSSFLTGSNPGETGVYGFERRTPFEYDTNVVNSRYLGEILPESVDGSSVMINVPMTYPAREINGVMVSGFPGSDRGQYAYPPTVKKDLEERDYTLSTAGTFDNEEELEKEVFDIYEKRRNLSLDYMDEYEWNLFMVMFTGDARLQHFSRPEECEVSLGRYYSELDDFLGEIDQKTDEDTDIILMSNHGFEEIDKRIYLYTFLKDNGYLEPEKPEYYENFLKSKIGSLLSFLGFSEDGEISREGDFSSEYMEEIDWDNTKAYTGAFYDGQIFINKEGREPNGQVSEEEYEEVRENIIEDLKQLRDPETGERVVENIYLKEEIYSGDSMENVPDIVIETPGYNHMARFGFGNTFLDNPVEKSTPTNEGFIISNQEIEKQRPTIIDLATTIANDLGSDFGEGEYILERSE